MFRHYLWATSRLKYILNRPKGCIFCNIVKGDPNTPSRILYKDKEMMVIMNMYPYNVGHLQVVPVRHVTQLEELSEIEFQKLWDLVKKSVVLLKKALNPPGFNIGMNIGGEISGGSILHLHVQIVPRYKRDAGFMEVTADTKVMPQSIDETYKILMKHADILKR